MKANNVKNENTSIAYKGEYKWMAINLKEELEKIVEMKSGIFNHSFRYDYEDKYCYIYDNDCYLFVFDKKIEVRSDRDNVFSANKTFTYKITDVKTIQTAYEHFCSVTMEGDEEY